MRTRLIVFALILAAGAYGVWHILQSSQTAAIIFGLSVLFLALSILRRPAGTGTGGKDGGKTGSKLDAVPGGAVAFRQSRAMVRGEEGEIRGLPGGPS
jgi:hypothetical protein